MAPENPAPQGKTQPHKSFPPASLLQSEWSTHVSGSWAVTAQVFHRKPNLSKCSAHSLMTILSYTALALNCEEDPRATLVLRTHQSFCCEQILSDTELVQITVPSLFEEESSYTDDYPSLDAPGLCERKLPRMDTGPTHQISSVELQPEAQTSQKHSWVTALLALVLRTINAHAVLMYTDTAGAEREASIRHKCQLRRASQKQPRSQALTCHSLAQVKTAFECL